MYPGRDAALNRDVAVKVLPSMLAVNPERLARFKREAQVLASLNRPNIAHVYGFESAALLTAPPRTSWPWNFDTSTRRRL